MLWIRHQQLNNGAPFSTLINSSQVHPGERPGTGVGPELLCPVRSGESNDAHSGCPGGLDSRRSVFHYQALRRRHRESCSRHQVDIRAGFSVHHVLGTDENARDAQAGPTKTRPCGGPGTRGAHRPASRRQHLQKTGGPGDRFHGSGVRTLVGHECGYLCLRVQLWRGQLDRLERAPAMTYPQKWLRGQTLRHGPAAPLLFHVPGRIDQYPIEVEQNRAALESFHSEENLPAIFDPASDGAPERRMADRLGSM